MNVCTLLSWLVPQRPAPTKPRRIVLILPCCIGDVVLGTAALAALRRAYPQAHITWAVGSWSRAAVEHHNLLDAVLDTGQQAIPGVWQLARQLRAGGFDLAVSLVRSPRVSLAVLLSGIPHRAGLDSAGRGFGYSVRAPVDPRQPRHEADVYLDVARALGINVSGCWANVPVRAEDRQRVPALLMEQGITPPYIVIHPGGGRNPGMIMDAKRWLPEHFAVLTNRLSNRMKASVVVVAGPADQAIVDRVQTGLDKPAAAFVGKLIFGEIAALARDAVVYIGNDTGLTHLAAAAGARTVMILGPSDPKRYAPFTPRSLALWKPTAVQREGVSAGTPRDWDWRRDGIGVDEAEQQIVDFLTNSP
jgi:ADP-heptose:LPS heptosyltransferase